MDMCYINLHSDDAQKKLIILSKSSRFLFPPLVPWLVGKNYSPYHAVLNCELCAWDIVECDVKHTVSVSFWSSFRQDTERLLFLISSACNGSDSWCVCVCCNHGAVSHRYCTCSSLDTPQHRPSSWLLPRWKYAVEYIPYHSVKVCKHLGFLAALCRGRVSHLSC